VNIDETLLRAYVDGELSAAERSQVEAGVAQNQDLKLMVEALQASRLPFQTAFDSEPVVPMPETLASQLSHLSAVAASNQTPAQRWFVPHWAIGAAIAASFIAGIVLRPAMLEVTGHSTAAALPQWVNAVASYQSLYVRDTVDRPADSADRAAATVAEFQAKTQTVITIPNLEARGFEFKRVQHLSFKNEPLLQIAYLPTKGKTGALCVMKNNSGNDSPVSATTVDSLSVVTWKRGNLDLVFVADMPLEQARAIGLQLSESKS
jgi:anti-sigma factor RsiW